MVTVTVRSGPGSIPKNSTTPTANATAEITAHTPTHRGIVFERKRPTESRPIEIAANSPTPSASPIVPPYVLIAS